MRAPMTGAQSTAIRLARSTRPELLSEPRSPSQKMKRQFVLTHHVTQPAGMARAIDRCSTVIWRVKEGRSVDVIHSRADESNIVQGYGEAGGSMDT